MNRRNLANILFAECGTTAIKIVSSLVSKSFVIEIKNSTPKTNVSANKICIIMFISFSEYLLYEELLEMLRF